MNPALRRRAFRGLYVVVLASGLAAFATEPTQPKDHVLFVGSDFGVVMKGEEHPVIDAGNRTFVFQDGAKRREMALNALPNIRIHRGIKLTNLSATIGKVEATLSSDAVNAEVAEATLNSMALAMAADIQRDHAFGQMVDADVGRGASGSSNSKIYGASVTQTINTARQQSSADAYVAAEQLRTQQFRFINQMIETAGSQSVNDGDEVEITPDFTGRSAGLSVSGQLPKVAVQPGKQKEKVVAETIVDAGNGRSDHLDLEFDLSSAQPLASAYIVVTTEYNIPKSNEVFRRVLTQRVGRIDAKPKKISLYEANFPEGFHLRTYTINVYANGQEVATNLSETQMTMTRDEAYQYLMVDYLASHRGKSSPPAAVLMAPRAQLANALQSPETRQPIYVNVDSNGVVTSVSADSRQNTTPDPTVLTALRQFRFIPALDNGKPVSGRAKIVLADFTQ